MKIQQRLSDIKETKRYGQTDGRTPNIEYRANL